MEGAPLHLSTMNSDGRSTHSSHDASNSSLNSSILSSGSDPMSISELVNHEPYLDISENPKARGYRFRCTCDGPSHGGILGESSDKNKKTYPAAQIKNYTGYARILVHLVTNEQNLRLHPHTLVGEQCQNGICTGQCGPKDMTVTFPNLGILRVTEENVAKILEEKYLDADLPSYFNHFEDKRGIHTKAANGAKSIDLSVVRLMFIAYLPDSTNAFTLMLKPVISDAIFDSRTLKICRMHKSNGAANGMDEIYMLCDGVQNDDIQVRFYEKTPLGYEIWESYGEFSPTDVHRQSAIVFRTPRYRNLYIDSPVHVQVQLERKSDTLDVSEPCPFTYMPVQGDPEKIGQKRPKIQTHLTDHISGQRASGSSGSQATSAITHHTQGGFDENTGRPTSPKDHYHQKGPVELSVLLARRMQSKQGPEIAEDSSQNMLDEIIALSQRQSGLTETIHTMTGSGLQNNNEIMEILLNSVTVEPDSVMKTMQVEDDECDTCIISHQAEIPLGSKIGLQNFEKTTEKNEKETTTPLQTAPQEVKIKSLQKLLIDITVRTAKAMQEFASTGDIRILLATHRRLTDMEDKDGNTPLHLAVINRQDQVLHALIQLIQTIPGNGDIINRQNDKKFTPLHVAVHSENANAVKWLMGAGADALVGDMKGNTAIQLACINGQTDILEIILMHTEDTVEPRNYKL